MNTFYAASLSSLIVLTPVQQQQQEGINPGISTKLIRIGCLDNDTMERILAFKHNERPVMQGDMTNGGTFELWINDNGSFTVIMKPFEGIACVAIDGENLVPVRRGSN